MKSEVKGTVRYEERGQGYRDFEKVGKQCTKERRGYSHPKEEALDRTVWRAGFGPVVSQTAK
jgi:hypothetical protein